jgi:hypothetical protein
MTDRKEQLELEIAAFQGPHIKRARIVLAALGALYFITGWLDYSKVAELRHRVERYGELYGRYGEAFERVESAVTLAYAVVVGAIVAGIANMLLAAIAGKKTMPAFYAAAAIFVSYSLLQLYVSEGVLLSNVVWWLTAIVLGMGFFAALKAERMRASATVP